MRKPNTPSEQAAPSARIRIYLDLMSWIHQSYVLGKLVPASTCALVCDFIQSQLDLRRSDTNVAPRHRVPSPSPCKYFNISIAQTRAGIDRIGLVVNKIH